MGNRTALQFRAGDDDIKSFLERLNTVEDSVKRLENARLRGYAYAIASRLVPTVQAAVRSSPAPQAGALAATARAKRDRMVVVQVGATNPRLSGWRRSAGNKQWRGSVAWGVEKGNFPGTRDEYGIGRSSRGHGIGRRLDAITEQVTDDYAEVILEIAENAGLT